MRFWRTKSEEELRLEDRPSQVDESLLDCMAEKAERQPKRKAAAAAPGGTYRRDDDEIWTSSFPAIRR